LFKQNLSELPIREIKKLAMGRTIPKEITPEIPLERLLNPGLIIKVAALVIEAPAKDKPTTQEGKPIFPTA